MKILAIETSTMLGGLALMDSSEGLIAERRLNVRSTHSEQLMPELKNMLTLAGLGVGDLDGVAVSIGPGAFTGLRIGLSAAKGLAFSAGLKLIAVPTLEGVAYCLPYNKTPVCVMLDARKKEVYAGLYDTSGGIPIAMGEPSAISASDYAASLSGHDEAIFIGQGALAYKDAIQAAFPGRAVFAPAHLMVPSPASVASLGLGLLARGGLPDPVALTPAYLRKSEAELKAK